MDPMQILAALAGGRQPGAPGPQVPQGVGAAQGILPPGFSMMGVQPTGPGNMPMPPRPQTAPQMAGPQGPEQQSVPFGPDALGYAIRQASLGGR